MLLNSVLNKGLKPLTIVGMLTAASSPMYGDFDMHSDVLSVINNPHTSRYISEIDNAEESYMMAKRAFHSNLDEWKAETMFLSSTSDIINNSHFQSIISMGKKAVPFIVEEINSDPSELVWALNIIYNKKISNRQNLTITEACRLWVKMLQN